MTKILLFSTILITLNFVTSVEIRCLNCDPSQTNICSDGSNGQIESIICELPTITAQRNPFKKQILNIGKTERNYQSGQNNNATINFECYSIYVRSDDVNQNGTHRGCVVKGDNVQSTCDLIKEEFKDGNVTACETCNSDNCNIIELKGSNANFIQPIILLLLNAILALLIFNFN